MRDERRLCAALAAILCTCFVRAFVHPPSVATGFVSSITSKPSACSIPYSRCSARLLVSAAAERDADDALFAKFADRLGGVNLFLIGMMGSGKSTTGAVIAEKLGYRFIDTDGIAELSIGMPIAEYFKMGKEPEFRELEYNILMELQKHPRLVVSTGGGIVLKKENWGFLRHGIVTYLELTNADLYTRLSSDPANISRRPLLQTDDPRKAVDNLLSQRKEYYEHADVRVPISLSDSPADVAVSVAHAVMSTLDKHPPFWATANDKLREYEEQQQAKSRGPEQL